MKEIKAYVHASRIADVIAGLKGSAVWGDPNDDEHNLAVYVVKGSLVPLDDAERHYSLELGEEIINEYKVELHCHDDDVPALVDVIRRTARTGSAVAGWIYVMDIASAEPIR